MALNTIKDLLEKFKSERDWAKDDRARAIWEKCVIWTRNLIDNSRRQRKGGAYEGADK